MKWCSESQPSSNPCVLVAPCDLIEGCGVELVRGPVPLRWVSEVVPKTEAYFSIIPTHGLHLLTTFRLLEDAGWDT